MAGVFAGVDRAIEERVEHLYTEDARITRDQVGLARPAWFVGDELNATRTELQRVGGVATARFEAQFILSRRSLVEAYLEENEQYEVGFPGGSDPARNQYAMGLLVGMDAGAPAWEAMRGHLVGGRLPSPDATTMELVLGLDRLASMVPQEEREKMSAWPPATGDLSGLRFEITSGVVRSDTSYKDVIRRPARVVGVFDTGIELVDSFSAWTHRVPAAELSGGDAHTANAWTVKGAVPRTVWAQEDAESFAATYVGAMLVVVRVLAQVAVGLLLAAPLFLVWNNVQQVLDRQRRELVVCRAIGIRTPLPQALFVLAFRSTGVGLLLATLLMAILLLVLPGVLATWDALPVPASFALDLATAFLLLTLIGLGTALAVVSAWRAHIRMDAASVLRTA